MYGNFKWLLNWSGISSNWLLCPLLADARIEEFVYEKLDRKAPSRMNNPELLGQYMVDSGNEFGPGTAYGKQQQFFVKCWHQS